MPPKKPNKKRGQASSNKPAQPPSQPPPQLPPPPPSGNPTNRLKIVIAVVGVLGIGIVALVLWLIYFVHPKPLPTVSMATYVGKDKCAECHAAEVQGWRNSHHAQAMQVTNRATVLGDFKNA